MPISMFNIYSKKKESCGVLRCLGVSWSNKTDPSRGSDGDRSIVRRSNSPKAR